jgi:FtsZ-binding cell division protein ZapB
MDQMDYNQGSEDNTEATEHVRNAQENRDALEEQARRVDATAPDTDQPVEGFRVDGMGGEDNSQASENLRRVQENTDALRDQARRVDASAPDDINRTGPQDG